MTINNELLAKFEGRWKRNTNHDWKYVPFSSHHGWEEDEYECSFCGKHVKTNTPPQELCPDNSNPSYSTSPADRERLWFFLVRDKKEMYYEFHEWAEFNYGQQMYRIDFDIWLSLPNDDGVPRWVSLLSEWLQLDSTIRRFGYEQGELTVEAAWDDGDWGTGKCTALSEWARYVKEAK